jgi:hypothetical protein
MVDYGFTSYFFRTMVVTLTAEKDSSLNFAKVTVCTEYVSCNIHLNKICYQISTNTLLTNVATKLPLQFIS